MEVIVAKVDNTLGQDPKLREEKREDADERLGSARKAGRVRSFDRDDDSLGWDAQQGGAPRPAGIEDDEEFRTRRGAPGVLYADDPIVYREDQLPHPDVLREDGYEPVIPEHQAAGGALREGDGDGEAEATLQDGGPQTANIQDPEATEPVEVETEDDKDSKSKGRAKKSTSSSKKS